MRRYADSLLPGRSIDNKKCFLRLQKFFELFELLNQRGVDFLPTCRVEDADIRWMSILRFECSGCGALHIFLVWIWSENRNVDLFAERRELFDRCRPLQIQGN